MSDTATVTVSNILFYDDCTSDRNADYEAITINDFNGTPQTWSYDSVNECYNLGTGSTNSHFYGFTIKNLSNVGNCKITAKVQIGTTLNSQIGIGLYNNSDTTVQIVSRLVKVNNTTSIIRVNPDTTIANTSQTISTNTWYTMEFENNNGTLTYNLYNSNGTLLKTLSGTTTLLSNNNTPMIYFAYERNQTANIKEIKVESL